MSIVNRRPRLEIILLFIIIILLLIVLGVVCNRCCKTPDSIRTDTIGSWNLHLPQPTSDVASTIAKVEQQLLDSLAGQGYNVKNIHFNAYFCPCDSLLISLLAVALEESSGSKVPPTGQPTAVTGPSGGSSFPLVNYNTPLAMPEIQDRQSFNIGNADTTGLQVYSINPKPPIKTIGIIDTGIDSVLGAKLTAYLVTRTPKGIYNFLPGANPQNYYDDDTYMHHGTLVTSVVAKSYDPFIVSLQVLMLKALDSGGHGSTFTVSCALSYAIQQKVDAINLSLGYYGKKDSILQVYVQKANDCHIPVVAAAGNTPGAHNEGLVPYTAIATSNGTFSGPYPYPNLQGSLTDTTSAGLFYPGSFCKTMPYVLSVTGFNNTKGEPCYYQNYSSTSYVSLGVSNKQTTCAYQWLSQGAEGSSFEAPVIAANIISTLPPMGMHATKAAAIQYVTSPIASSPTFTSQGYITH